jgi:hypothetical protein
MAEEERKKQEEEEELFKEQWVRRSNKLRREEMKKRREERRERQRARLGYAWAPEAVKINDELPDLPFEVWELIIQKAMEFEFQPPARWRKEEKIWWYMSQEGVDAEREAQTRRHRMQMLSGTDRNDNNKFFIYPFAYLLDVQVRGWRVVHCGRSFLT